MRTRMLARNTFALYGRQLLILVVSLYMVRALLHALGQTDFALYSVLISVVAIGSFLPFAMGMMAQRFFSFAIGRGDPLQLKAYHDTGLILYVLATIGLVIMFETLGSWFIRERLAVDPARLDAAQLYFHLAIWAFAITNLATFYSSVILAHEDMHLFAICSVAEALLKLAAVFAATLFAGDTLVLYGAFLLLVSLIILGLYLLVALRRYPECDLRRLRPDRTAMKDMLGFSAWSIFGQITTISRNQMVTILINQSYGPATLAARAIAVSLAGQALNFSASFANALTPPIIKAHAAREHQQMFELIGSGSRITFFLMWVISLPVIAVMPQILQVWLGTHPPETALFARLGLIETLIVSINYPLMAAVRSTGRVQRYELILGSLQLLVLLVSWLLMLTGSPAWSVYLVAIAVNLLMWACRLAIVHSLLGLPLRDYMRHTIWPAGRVVAVSALLAWAAGKAGAGLLVVAPVMGTFAMAAALFVMAAASICLLGLTGAERAALIGLARTAAARIGRRP